METDMPIFTVRTTRRGIGALDIDKPDVIETITNVDKKTLESNISEILTLVKDSKNKTEIREFLIKISLDYYIFQEDLEIFCLLLVNCDVEDILRIKAMKKKSENTMHSEFNALRDLLHYCGKYGMYKVKLSSKKQRKNLTKCIDLFMGMSKYNMLTENDLTLKDYKALNLACIGYKNVRKSLKKCNYKFPPAKVEKISQHTTLNEIVLHKRVGKYSFKDSPDKTIIRNKIYPDDIFAEKVWDDEIRKYNIKNNELSQQNENLTLPIYMQDSPIEDVPVKLNLPKDMPNKHLKRKLYKEKLNKDLERLNNNSVFQERFKKVDSFIFKAVGVDTKIINKNMKKECRKLEKIQEKKLKKYGKREYIWYLENKRTEKDIVVDIIKPVNFERRREAKKVFEKWNKSMKNDVIKENYYKVLSEIDNELESEEDVNESLIENIEQYGRINTTVQSSGVYKKRLIKHETNDHVFNDALFVKNDVSYCHETRNSINRKELLLKLNKKLHNNKVIMIDDLTISLNSKSYASRGYRRDLRGLIECVYDHNKKLNDIGEDYFDEDDYHNEFLYGSDSDCEFDSYLF